MQLLNFLMVLLILEGTRVSSTTVQLHNPDGGEFTSPLYPKNYPSSMRQRYYLKAPNRNHIVVVTFHDFRTERPIGDHKTDYAELIDGKHNSDVERIYLQGSPKLPYTFKSSGNRAWIVMYSDGSREYRGFKATYKFIDTTKYCLVTSLDEPDVGVITCKDETLGYAKECSRLEGHYKVVYNCTDGEFVPIAITLDDELLKLCEYPDTKSQCPYDDEEIEEYYEALDELENTNLTEEERAAKLFFEEQEEAAGGVGRGVRCNPVLCCRRSNRDYIYPESCRDIKKRWRKLCRTCRRINCGLSASLFGGSARSRGGVCSFS